MQSKNTSKELISVIVPIYNIKDCLERCVDSILAQTYTALDIILVDDGSDDGTEGLADKLAEKDGRIRVFHKENGGSSSARNLGIREARGLYLGFVDSDDFIDSRMYERLMECIRIYGLPIAQVSRDEIAADGKRLADVCSPPEKITVCGAEAFIRELLLHRGDCSFCTKLTDRKLFENHRFPEGVLNEDFHLLMELLQEIEGIVVAPEQYYHVFYRIGSNTRKRSKNEFSRVYRDIVDHADEAEEIVREKYPALKPEAVRFGLFQRLDYLLHVPITDMTEKNEFYKKVRRYIRSHVTDTLINPYLTRKNKLYLLFLAAAPKTVRRIHCIKMKAAGRKETQK